MPTLSQAVAGRRGFRSETQSKRAALVAGVALIAGIEAGSFPQLHRWVFMARPPVGVANGIGTRPHYRRRSQADVTPSYIDE